MSGGREGNFMPGGITIRSSPVYLMNLGKTLCIKPESGAMLIPCQSRMPTISGWSSGLTMTLPACKSVCHSTGNDIRTSGRTCGKTASNWSRRLIWKSGEVSNVEQDMTSLTDRERVNSLSDFCWILMIARINDNVSGPE
jgi:hypothetical protein